MELNSIFDVGEFIIESRKKHNLTQNQVALATKVERSLINRLEKGKASGITLKTLNKIVNGLKGKAYLSL